MLFILTLTKDSQLPPVITVLIKLIKAESSTLVHELINPSLLSFGWLVEPFEVLLCALVDSYVSLLGF